MKFLVNRKLKYPHNTTKIDDSSYISIPEENVLYWVDSKNPSYYIKN